MTAEERLRRAVEERTGSIEPSDDGLDRIAARLEGVGRDDRGRRALLGLASAAAIVAIAIGAAVWIASDDESAVVSDSPVETTAAPPTTSTSTSTTTTTTPATTIAPTTTVPPPAVDPAAPIWPRPEGPDHFGDPRELATSFAVDYVGMVDPVVGELVPGDERSGDVLVRPTAESPATVVHVRKLEDDTWYVVGADTGDIRLDTPAGGAIGCPVRLTGDALAYEGHVVVEVRADGVADPIGAGYVLGGGGPAAPFDGTVECDVSKAPSGRGAIILFARGGRDDATWMATVVRVRFG